MKKGFTLLEFIVVLTITGILLTIALPQYIAHKNRRSGTENRSEANAEVLEQSAHHEKFRVKSPSGKCYEVFYTSEDIRLNSVTEIDCR